MEKTTVEKSNQSVLENCCVVVFEWAMLLAQCKLNKPRVPVQLLMLVTATPEPQMAPLPSVLCGTIASPCVVSKGFRLHRERGCARRRIDSGVNLFDTGQA